MAEGVVVPAVVDVPGVVIMEEEEAMGILDEVGAVACPVAMCRWQLMFSDGHGGEQERRKPPIKTLVMIEIMLRCCAACYMFVSQ